MWLCKALLLLASAAFSSAFPVEMKNIPTPEALRFLKKFGYLDDGPLDAEALYEQEAITEAVRTMQHFGNIPETGVVDNKTLELMATPRCGVPDVRRTNKQFPSGNRQKRYIIGADGWRKRKITYFVANWSPKLGGYEEVLEQMKKAFEIWSGYSRLQFEHRRDPSADIIVAFGSYFHGDQYPFDGPNGILAHAYYPYEFDSYGGDIHFDDDENWVLHPNRSYPGVHFLAVATHELGHSLGLAHSPIPGSVMFPYYRGYNPNVFLDYDDILAVYQLYISRHIEEVPGVPEDEGDVQTEAPAVPTTTTAPTTTTTTTTRTTTTRRPTTDDTDESDSYEYVDAFDEDTVDNQADEGKNEVTPGYENDYDTVDEHRKKTKKPVVPPTVCKGSFDSIAVLRGELFLFKEHFLWRLERRGRLEPGYPVPISYFFPGFPETLEKIDAAYERPTDGAMIFFTGSYFWVYDGEKFKDSPRPISEFGLPRDLDHIDAAFVWGKNRKTYFFSGNEYWRYVEEDERMDEGYPQKMYRWSGIPSPINAVISWTDGLTYFFKGMDFWRFNDYDIRADDGYPRDAAEDWMGANC